MVIRRAMVVVLLAGGAWIGGGRPCTAQCCLEGLFAGCGSCFRKAPPAYAVAPVMAPIPAPPPPVMVPVQQVSYVPETTYQTKYECVPVTSYKPSCEIDPCTGCSRECMEQVVNYQQRPVNVPVTQYRAVYSTKYVQMQPGYSPAGYPAAPAYAPAPAPAAASPFAAPVQTSPQAWGAAGADVPQQLVPGQSSFAAPALPPSPAMPPATMPQSTFQQQVIPQSGTYVSPGPAQTQLQPTAPPALTPTPSLKPIPELPRTAPANGGNSIGGTGVGGPAVTNGNGAAGSGQAPPAAGASQRRPLAAPSLAPIQPSAVPMPGANGGTIGMPVLPGPGPGPATGAFPKLLEPTGHTTQFQPQAIPTSAWQATAARAPAAWPAVPPVQPGAYASVPARGGYPTAALPIRSQQ